MEPYELLIGNWRPGEVVDQRDYHTRVTELNDQHPLILRGSGAFVRSDENDTLYLHVSRPGMQSLWYGVAGGRVFWNESKWPLEKTLRMAGGGKATRVEAGTLIAIGEPMQPVVVDTVPYTRVRCMEGLTLTEAADQLWDLYLSATEEMWTLAGRPRVAALASAGTDSTMGIIALRQIGADVHAVSVGRSLDDFDPQYAEKYAAHLGVPFTLLSLPESDRELRQLAIDTIAAIEYAEMSNTLMGMCTTLVRRWAVSQSRPCLWKGHYADDLLGTNNVTYGSFKKQWPDKTDQQWTNFRAEMYQDIIPNDMQVAQVCRRGKTFWRSTFYHPSVAEFVWACPIEVVPLELRKPLFETICDKFLAPGMGSWHHQKRKVGYYSGSGIGKIRLDNPVLKDESFRSIYKAVKEQLT